MTPAYLPLTADRGLAFNEQVAFFGLDFTGSAYRMQIRIEPDAPGTALVSLATTTSSTAAGVRLVYAGTDTLANHVSVGHITQAQADAAKAANGYTDASSVALSVLNIRILAATMELPTALPEVPGGKVDLAYDLLVTLPGGDETKYAYGPFTLRGTVTQ